MAKYLSVTDVMKRTGYTRKTVYQYTSKGILPPPRKRDGWKMLFDAGDIAYFKKIHKGYSVERRLAKRRKRSRR